MCRFLLMCSIQMPPEKLHVQIKVLGKDEGSCNLAASIIVSREPCKKQYIMIRTLRLLQRKLNIDWPHLIVLGPSFHNHPTQRRNYTRLTLPFYSTMNGKRGERIKQKLYELGVVVGEPVHDVLLSRANRLFSGEGH